MRSRRSHVEITERSIFIDGQDVSHLTRSVGVSVGVNQAPAVYLELIPHLVTLDLVDAVVAGWPPPPLDGIERLRGRLGQ